MDICAEETARLELLRLLKTRASMTETDMEAECSNPCKRARLTLPVVTGPVPGHSEHNFCLELLPYSQKDCLTRFLSDSNQGPVSVSFNFSNGNLTELENLFTFTLEFLPNTRRLICKLDYKIKRVPWKVAENSDAITVDNVWVGVVNESGSLGGTYAFFSAGIDKNGFRLGKTNKIDVSWDKDSTEIKIVVKVTRKAEMVEIVPVNFSMMTSSSFNYRKTMNTSFSKYFMADTLSDCKVVVGEKIFPAHRFVLTEISESFQRMFSTDMVENQNRVWKIDDFDSYIVREFLEFAYTGTSENLKSANSAEFLMDLYRMGHKYDVTPLKIQCEESLINLINAENVVDLFQFGFLYEARSLAVAAKYQFDSFYKLQLLPNLSAVCELVKNYPNDMVHELLIK